MNGEHLSTELLQRGYDGDLSNQEAAELHVHLAACPQCQTEFDKLGRLGQLMRWASQEASTTNAAGAPAAPDFRRIFAGIQNEITSTPPVIASATRDQHGQRSKKPLHRTPRWLYGAAPALGTIALAAAALLMVQRQDTVPGDVGDGQPYEVAPPARSEIVAVDFGTNAGTVFDIPMSDGPSIPVVWIDDDDDDEE